MYKFLFYLLIFTELQNTAEHKFELIVIGVSAGGMNTLPAILSKLPSGFPTPIIIIQHLHPQQSTFYIEYYSNFTQMKIIEALDKQSIEAGSIYFAPPDYHLLIEDSNNLSLSKDDKVNFSRPSIDVLFESAANVFADKTIAILLTGANNDGAIGCKLIQDSGGLVIVQSPESAEHRFMPQSAINIMQPDLIAPPEQIAQYLIGLF